MVWVVRYDTGGDGWILVGKFGCGYGFGYGYGITRGRREGERDAGAVEWSGVVLMELRCLMSGREIMVIDSCVGDERSCDIIILLEGSKSGLLYVEMGKWGSLYT